MTLEIRVIPRASRTGIDGLRDGRLIVRVTAPPVDSAANAAVQDVVAAALDLPRRAVRVIRGQKARNKTLDISGIDETELRRRISALGTTPR